MDRSAKKTKQQQKEKIKQMSSGLFKNVTDKLFTYKSYKQDLALNNQQGMICHKTQPNFINPAI